MSRFRKHAHDCRELAKSARSEDERALLREIAGHWDAIADLHERLRPPRGSRD